MGELMRTVTVKLTDIYVPVKLAKTLDSARVETRAEDILAHGLEAPVQLRRDDERNRYVLVSGLHRLEAVRALGEDTIEALIVHARRR